MHKDELFMNQGLSITVLGASGDLAKKKTFPALLDLYSNGYLPRHCVVMAYARSDMSNDSFREYISSVLKGKAAPEVVTMFVLQIYYCRGSYDSNSDFSQLSSRLDALEQSSSIIDSLSGAKNRLFYFAVPPNVFIPAASAIRQSAMTQTGWNRLIGA